MEALRPLVPNLATIKAVATKRSIIDDDTVGAYGTLTDGRWFSFWNDAIADNEIDLVRLHMTSEQRAALRVYENGFDPPVY